VTNKLRSPNGAASVYGYVGDYTNPILKPQAAASARTLDAPNGGRPGTSSRPYPATHQTSPNRCALRELSSTTWVVTFLLIRHHNNCAVHRLLLLPLLNDRQPDKIVVVSKAGEYDADGLARLVLNDIIAGDGLAAAE
jgi:hypothetical protein